MNLSISRCAISLTLALLASPVVADHQEENSALQDAWLDGKLDTVVMLNRDLNPLEIDTDVVDGRAIITGTVNSPVQKILIDDLALSIDGIHAIDNHLVVELEPFEADDTSGPIDDIIDASITTAVAMKLMLNSEIDSSKIEVETTDKAVILEGRIDTEFNSNLAEQIAMSTFEVEAVYNRLIVVN